MVPRKLMLTRWLAKRSGRLGEWLRGDAFLKKADAYLHIALLLLHEEAQLESEWRAYLDVLPRTFHTPLWWTRAELRELRGSPLAYEVVHLYKKCAYQYCQLYGKFLGKEGALFSVAWFTATRFWWALSIVFTRQNRVPLGPKNKLVECLIPMVRKLKTYLIYSIL